MKRLFSLSLGIMIILSVMFSMTGCNNVYFDREECQVHIDEFMENVLTRDPDKLSAQAYMDATDFLILRRYKDDAFVSKVMEKAQYDVYMDNVRQVNQKVYFDVFLTLPDFTSAYRGAPTLGDLEYYSQAIEQQSKNKYKTSEITVVFNIKYNVWIVNNLKELIEDIYGEMFMVVSEGRTIPPIGTVFETSKADSQAFYRHAVINDVNFRYAIDTVRKDDIIVNKIEGDDVTKYGLEGQSVRYVLDSGRGKSQAKYVLYCFASTEDAKNYFDLHSDPGQDDIQYYYMSQEWGYARDMSFDGVNLYYWCGDKIVYAEIPETARENDDYMEEYVNFWVSMDIIG